MSKLMLLLTFMMLSLASYAQNDKFFQQKDGMACHGEGSSIVCEKVEENGLNCKSDESGVIHCSTEIPTEHIMKSGDACYSECKSQKKILGILGKEESGLDRASCLKCIKGHPELYKLKDDPSNPKCTVSNDRIYAICDGITYKRDTSINDLDRQLIKEFSNEKNSQPNSKQNKKSGANKQ